MSNLSRRELLGGAGAAVPMALAAAPGRVIGANDRINVAIIGLGNLGLRHLRDRLLPQQRENKPSRWLRPAISMRKPSSVPTISSVSKRKTFITIITRC